MKEFGEKKYRLRLAPKAIHNYWLRRNGLRNLHVLYCLGDFLGTKCTKIIFAETGRP